MDAIAFTTAYTAAEHDHRLRELQRHKHMQRERYEDGRMLEDDVEEYIEYTMQLDQMIRHLKDLRDWYKRCIQTCDRIRHDSETEGDHATLNSLMAQQRSAERNIRKTQKKIKDYSSLLLRQSEIEEGYSSNDDEHDSSSSDEDSSSDEESEYTPLRKARRFI